VFQDRSSPVEVQMSQLRVGLAGLGVFGQLHASILHHLPHARLAAICDVVPDKVESTGRRFGVSKVYVDYDAMLEEVPLDAVFVVTDEASHAEMVQKAAGHGRHVFVEKPLSTSYARGREVVAAVDAAGVQLQVGYILRFEPRHALLKQQIAEGAFGRLATIRCKRNCSANWFRLFGHRVHPVHEAITHDVDLCLWYTGSRCREVYAVQRSLLGFEHPDVCVALLRFEDDTVAFVETSWLAPEGAPDMVGYGWDISGVIDAKLEIVGEDRTATLDFCTPALTIWGNERTQHPELTTWPVMHGQTVGALRDEIAHFVDAVLEGKPSRVASVADALEGLRIAEAIVASAEEGRPVALAANQ
jgi:predicted dehydrogenase